MNKYLKLESDPNNKILSEQHNLIDGYFNYDILQEITGYPEKGGRMIKTCFKTNIGFPYPLFKIHKLTTEEIEHKKIPPSRLVHSLCQSPTTRLEKYLAYTFGDVSRLYAHEEYIRDTSDFLSILQNTTLDKDDLLATLDVKTLYPSMQIDMVMESVVDALTEDTTLDSHIRSGIAPCIKFCLDNSVLGYKGSYYKANKGVPTGGSISRPLADTFMFWLKKNLKTKIDNWDQFIRLWKRFIDDIFLIWSGTFTQFEYFLIQLNREAAVFGIEFTGGVGKSVNFLDVTIDIVDDGKGGKYLETSLYKKPTDNRSYLRRDSYHPQHTFKGVPYSQLLRTKVICSTEDLYKEGAAHIIEDLKASGYKESEIQKACNRVSQVSRDERLNPVKDCTTTEQTELVLVTQYCSEMKQVKSFVDDKQVEISAIIGEPSRTILSYKRGQNISDQLFRRRKFARMNEARDINCTPDLDKNLFTSQKCLRPRCKACDLMCGTKTVNLGGVTINLDPNLDCSSCNIIYFAQCSHCINGFYIGQTWQTFSERLSKHRSSFNEGKEKQSALALHIKLCHNWIYDKRVDNFKFGVILKTDLEKLNMFEDSYIEKTRARIIGLNRIKVARK